MIPDYFTYSSLQSYQKCPAQFQFRYIKRIFKDGEGIEAFMGKRVHETIEYIYDQKKSGVNLSFDKIIQYHHSEFIAQLRRPKYQSRCLPCVIEHCIIRCHATTKTISSY